MIISAKALQKVDFFMRHLGDVRGVSLQLFFCTLLFITSNELFATPLELLTVEKKICTDPISNPPPKPKELSSNTFNQSRTF